MDTIWEDIIKPFKTKLMLRSFVKITMGYINFDYKSSTDLLEYYRKKSVITKIKNKEPIKEDDVLYINKLMRKDYGQYGKEV